MAPSIYTCNAAARTTTSTTIQDASGALTTAHDGALLMFAIMLNNSGTLSTLNGWTRTDQGASIGGKTIGFYWRIYSAGERYPTTPTWDGGTQSALMLPAFFGYDPDDPFEGLSLSGAVSGSSYTAPPLTPSRPGSLAAWWWGGGMPTNVGGNPVVRPSGTYTPRAEPGDTMSSGSGAGVSMNFGTIADLSSGQPISAGAASTRYSVTWRSAGVVVKPAAGQVVTSAFLPFFGR